MFSPCLPRGCQSLYPLICLVGLRFTECRYIIIDEIDVAFMCETKNQREVVMIFDVESPLDLPG